MRRIARSLLFLLPVLILLPHLNQVPFQVGAAFTDLLVSHFPNTLYLQRALLEWKTIPLWSPTILSGYPFAANPLSGLYYPPGWLALLLPLPLGFNIAMVLHLIWGGVGMYLLLRAEGLAEPGALLGALTFEALPKVFAHLGAGHLTLIYAVAWTPWLLYVERRGSASRLPLAGAVLGLIFLADPRWGAYSALLWLAYSVYELVVSGDLTPGPFPKWEGVPSKEYDDGKFFSFPPSSLGKGGRGDRSHQKALPSSLPSFFLSLFANLLLAFLIAAPLLLPLAEYTRLSTRGLLAPEDNLYLSLPAGQLLGLIYPDIGGSAEWMNYPGAVVLALALFGLCKSEARRKAAFWLALIPLTLLFALGSHLAPVAWIARLPGMSLLRVPARVMFITGLAFAAAAGVGLDQLYAVLSGKETARRDRWGLALFALTAFIVLFAAAAWAAVDRADVRLKFSWGALFLLLGMGVIFLARARRISAGLLTVLIFTLSLVDLSGANAFDLDFRSFTQVLSDGSPALTYLNQREAGQLYRVYSPSYLSIPQHVAAWFGVELAEGVDPMQIRAYVDYMSAATGFPDQGYSVVLPPWDPTAPAETLQQAVPDPRRLGLLNVKYLVSPVALPEKDLTLLARVGQTRIYENQLALPRAWVQPASAAPGEQAQAVAALAEQPNAITVRAQGPGLLVLSQVAYPGWQVSVDGQAPAPAQTVGGLLRGVTLSAGEHRVRFFYRPLPVYLGLGLAFIGWLGLAALAWRGKARRSLEDPRHG